MTQTKIPLGDTATAATAAGDFAHLPLERVWADPDQPRRTFDEAFLAQLSESIKAQGVIQPIVVRPTSAAEATYTIISGESRWRASQMAGKKTIPALIRRDLSESDIAVMQILENLQRRDLTLIETCEGVTRLVKEIGLDKAADQLGMSKSWVSRHSTLAELPNEVLDLVKAGKLESIELAKDVAQLVQLDQKEAAVMIGRFNGEVTFYGRPAEAPDPEELATLSEEERQEELLDHERDTRPPTRADIRAALNSARHAEAIKKQAVERRQASKDDPEAIKQRAEAKKQAEKTKAENQRREAFKAQRESFEQDQTNALCAALSLKAPKRQSHGWGFGEKATVRIDTPLYPGSPVPAKFDTLDCRLDFNGIDSGLLRRIHSAGFHTAIEVEFDRNFKLTVEQAEALEKVLGPKGVRFGVEIKAKAHEVPGFVARFDKPAKVATAPLDGAMALNQFITAKVRKKAEARIKASDFYDGYRKHCKATAVRPLSLNDNEYGAVIEANGIEKIRSNGIHYVGIEVKA